MKEIYPIDSNGYVDWESDQHRLEPDHYEPQENEIDVPIPRDIVFIRPRWDGEKWVEGGEPSEPEPKSPLLPSIEQRIAAVEAALIEMAGEIYG